MKAIYDRSGALDQGLAAIRAQYRLPDAFPAPVTAAAEEAARRGFPDHSDRTSIDFATLDPASSTDLDQAFALDRAGGDFILHYAIADVAAFVDPGGLIDREAWARGETFYFPDRKVGLYPSVLSEGAASLLPDGPRPSILFHVRVSPDGQAVLDGVERALIRSRAKLGYATVTDADLPPGFHDFARLIDTAETARGAARIDPPQQQVVEREGRGYGLGFRPMSVIEQANASMSLAANLAIAKLMLDHRTGLFRIMAEPGQRATGRLRQTARALGLDWASNQPLEVFERALDPNRPADAAFMLAVRRAGAGAAYAPFAAGVTPWHSAMAATYAHGTAPLRRLADRYVTETALALANGRPVPDWVTSALPELAPVMNRAEARAAQIDGAVIELAEAVVLEARVGEHFTGQVVDIDERGAKIQLCDEAVVTRLPVDGLAMGQGVTLTLGQADPARRLTRFALDPVP